MNTHDHGDDVRGPAEVVLIFPPLTEARLFPYLSLPMLSAYLAEHGVEARCHDLNLRLAHRLLAREAFEAYLARPATDGATTLNAEYRRTLARYLATHAASLADLVFAGGAAGRRGDARELRLVNQGLELLLEGSQLKAQFHSLAALDAATLASETNADDLGVQALRAMFDDLASGPPPAVLGVSVAFYSQLLPALLLARWTRARWPSTLVVLGGPQIMLRADELRRMTSVRDSVHALCVGPGEQALLELVREVRSGRPALERAPELVPTAAAPEFRPSRSAVHIRDVPPPDFRDFPLERYVDEEPQLALITCVGCSWGRCAFCSYGARSRRRGYEQKSPAQLADECATLVARHAIRRINFVDENTNLKLVASAMRMLAARGVKIRFSVRNRFEKVLLDRGFCRELAELGCVLMSVGYETNSQRLIDLLDKGVDVADYQVIIDNLHEAGITLRLSIMGGLLDETPEEVAASEAFLGRNADKIGIDVMQMLVMEPGTPLAEDPARFKLTVIDDGQLRGNQRLNYGMGRVGLRFDHPDGDSFGARLDRFVALHRAVRPQKNDAVPPTARRRRGPAPPTSAPALALHPWVRVLQVPGPPSSAYVVDLVWESVYALPEGVIVEGDTLHAEGPARRRLAAFAAADLGRIAGPLAGPTGECA